MNQLSLVGVSIKRDRLLGMRSTVLETNGFLAGDISMTFWRPSRIQKRIGAGYSAQREFTLAGNMPSHPLRL